MIHRFYLSNVTRYFNHQLVVSGRCGVDRVCEKHTSSCMSGKVTLDLYVVLYEYVKLSIMLLCVDTVHARRHFPFRFVNFISRQVYCDCLVV